MKTSFRRKTKEVWTRPISQKAYYGFVARINEVFKSIPMLYLPGVLCKDFSADIKETVDMLDRHLAGEQWNREESSFASRVTFATLLPEIDKAMQRSAAAKARAALRRQKAIEAKTYEKETGASIRTEAAIESVETTKPSDNSDMYNGSDVHDVSDLSPNRPYNKIQKIISRGRDKLKANGKHRKKSRRR